MFLKRNIGQKYASKKVQFDPSKHLDGEGDMNIKMFLISL